MYISFLEIEGGCVSGVVISGSGLFTPPYAISNDELVASFNAYVAEYNRQHAVAIEKGEIEPLKESSAEFIEKASGIKQRYVMNKSGILDTNIMYPQFTERPDDQLSMQCEMTLAAAKEALAQAKKTPEEVDAIYVACTASQRTYPAIAIELQSALGMKHGYAFDLSVACSSATFGIQTAMNAVIAGQARCGLVLNPELCSAQLNFRNRDSHFIFGDACTATVIEKAETCRSNDAYEIIDCQLYTQFSNYIRTNFGFLLRSSPHTMDTFDKYFMQEGRKVFKEISIMVSDFIKNQLERLHLNPSDIQRLWLHQANMNMNRLIAEKILGKDAPEIQWPTVLDEYANTSSAGSIIAFHLHRDGLNSGDYGILCSFGAGYSLGSLVLKKL